jgi:phosphoglycolate phosphatase
MDGTLWDSAANVAVSWNLALRESGITDRTLTGADIQSVMGKTMDEIADILFGDMEKAERTRLLTLCCERENEYLREHGG